MNSGEIVGLSVGLIIAVIALCVLLYLIRRSWLSNDKHREAMLTGSNCSLARNRPSASSAQVRPSAPSVVIRKTRMCCATMHNGSSDEYDEHHGPSVWKTARSSGKYRSFVGDFEDKPRSRPQFRSERKLDCKRLAAMLTQKNSLCDEGISSAMDSFSMSAAMGAQAAARSRECSGPSSGLGASTSAEDSQPATPPPLEQANAARQHHLLDVTRRYLLSSALFRRLTSADVAQAVPSSNVSQTSSRPNSARNQKRRAWNYPMQFHLQTEKRRSRHKTKTGQRRSKEMLPSVQAESGHMNYWPAADDLRANDFAGVSNASYLQTLENTILGLQPNPYVYSAVSPRNLSPLASENATPKHRRARSNAGGSDASHSVSRTPQDHHLNAYQQQLAMLDGSFGVSNQAWPDDATSYFGSDFTTSFASPVAQGTPMERPALMKADADDMDASSTDSNSQMIRDTRLPSAEAPSHTEQVKRTYSMDRSAPTRHHRTRSEQIGANSAHFL